MAIIIFIRIFILLMNPGKILQTKFVKLGNMKGKTKAEIVRSVGSPTVITNNSDGVTCF